MVLNAVALLFLAVAQTDNPDTLYANRADLASARRAAALWEARLLRGGRDVDSSRGQDLDSPSRGIRVE